MENEPIPFGAKDSGPFYHDTKADLKAGDLLEPGYSSNYGERRTANYVNLSSAQIRRLNRPEATDSWFALVAAVAALASAFVVRP